MLQVAEWSGCDETESLKTIEMFTLWPFTE